MSFTSRSLLLAAVFAVTAVGTTLLPDAVAELQDKKGPAKKGGDADGKDDIPGGARWEWRILDADGTTARVGTFVGHTDGTIKMGKKQAQVGAFKVGKGEHKAIFTEGPLKGTLTMTLVERKPLKYKGELVREDGSKVKVTFEVIND